MNVYIVDDEFINRDTLKFLLAKYFPELVVLGEAEDYTTAVLDIQKLDIDILFLDVELSGGKTGFQIVDTLESYTGAVVFITAHEKYAIEAFRYNAVHYLLKPIDPIELGVAISRIKREKTQPEQGEQPQNRQSATISISNNKGIESINVNDILYAEAEGSYARIIRDNSHDITLSKNLKYVAQKLAGFDQFIRVHKSYLVNKNYVISFKRPNALEMKNKKLIPVSPTFKSVINELFGSDGA